MRNGRVQIAANIVLLPEDEVRREWDALVGPLGLTHLFLWPAN